ncbi:ABC transporter substrate-binding protein [Aeromicrobium tamlense]|uniref:ABC transporter substrate-binding protein n=1 Tax=Aeromicrobium tamlense TaxID=375541 RepID=A0A8I0FSS0_9ACTN|nr:ABC transporter substrate-binding protein [Aeromicrobium tamlense]MBD1269204.1 ABC transporter substrate-binding protein [Aeromicrobium tamlense]NYI36887.1 peptide/nickel transport system substrate-binding protein [Aeromicrobium tamlense]
MRMSSRIRVGLAAAMLVAVSACGGGGSDGGDGGTLRVATQADISSMDPIRGNSGGDHQMLYPLYDTLVSFDEDLQPQPGLAESWEYETPTALVLKLREGVTFHDGAPLDAEAVKYNLERAAAEGSNIAADVESIESVEVVDDLTVKLNLTQPNSALVMTLADRAGMMVSPQAAEAAGGDLSTNPVGAGGWKFVDWKRGTSMTYEKFDDYWDEDVERVDKVVIRVMPEPKTRATSLRSGQQDIAWDIVPADAESIQDDDKLTLHEQPRMWTWMIYTNRASEELGDPRVRRALSLAMDRDQLLKSAYFGLGTKPRGFLPDGYWAEPSEKAQLDYDVDEAKKLIAEAGAEGLSFDMLLYADSTSTRVGEILKQQWSEIGVTANLVPREVNQANSDYFNDVKTPAFFAAWTGRPDPALTYRLMFTKEAYFNTSKQSTPGIEEALAEDAVATTQEDRKKALDKASEAVVEDMPIIPIVFQHSLTGLGENVEGFESNLLGKPKLLGVTLK